MWRYYALLSAFFAALTAVLAKAGVRNINGNVATAIRTLVVLFMAWGIVLLSGQLGQVRNLGRNNVIFLVLSGIATGLSWIFYFKALETGAVSKVAAIDKLSVAIAIGISVVLLKESPDIKTIAGGVLITAGAIIIVL